MIRMPSESSRHINHSRLDLRSKAIVFEADWNTSQRFLEVIPTRDAVLRMKGWLVGGRYNP
jgi:hypothetical protein